MPYLLRVYKGKEKRIVEILLSHGISATAAPIGEYIICDKPFQIEVLDSWVFATTEIKEEIASAVMAGTLTASVAECLGQGRIVAITAGDYAGQMAVVKDVQENEVSVDVLVEGRMYPLKVPRETLGAPEIPETWR